MTFTISNSFTSSSRAAVSTDLTRSDHSLAMNECREQRWSMHYGSAESALAADRTVIGEGLHATRLGDEGFEERAPAEQEGGGRGRDGTRKRFGAIQGEQIGNIYPRRCIFCRNSRSVSSPAHYYSFRHATPSVASIHYRHTSIPHHGVLSLSATLVSQGCHLSSCLDMNGTQRSPIRCC